MSINVPAMRGRIGSRTYYSCLMPMKAIASLFKFTDWNGFSAKNREQLVLNKSRIPELCAYIVENEDDYLFSSITASYKSEPIYREQHGDRSGSIGTLELELGDELIINDGQHRCAGIVEAVKQNPAIGDHTISILLFPYESKSRVQQMFSDLNL